MDKNTFKVLKYINKHSGKVSYGKTVKKFRNLKNPSINTILSWLAINYYAHSDDYLERDSYGQPGNPQGITMGIKGEQEFEKLKTKKSGDIFAKIMSAIAILISIASLAVTYFKK